MIILDRKFHICLFAKPLSISILVASIFGCSTETLQDNRSTPEKIPHNVDSVTVTRTNPEIHEIQELRELLESSDKIIGYNFNGTNGNPANVECYDLYNQETKEICPTAINQVTLDSKHRNDLIKIASDTNSYSGTWSGLVGVCFVPHHGFAFFKSDSLIAQINICFTCSGIRTRPYYKSDGLTQIGIDKYLVLVKEIGLEVLSPSEYTH